MVGMLHGGMSRLRKPSTTLEKRTGKALERYVLCILKDGARVYSPTMNVKSMTMNVYSMTMNVKSMTVI